MKGEFKLPRGIPRRPPRRDAPAFFVADFKGSLCGCLLTRASHESDISLELETARDLAEERSLARLAVSKRVLRPNSPGSIAAFLTLTRKGTFLKSPTIGGEISRLCKRTPSDESSFGDPRNALHLRPRRRRAHTSLRRPTLKTQTCRMRLRGGSL